VRGGLRVLGELIVQNNGGGNQREAQQDDDGIGGESILQPNISKSAGLAARSLLAPICR
jgi:hypothetical protein